jgi:CPA2 family monovalent cation:H+ antiporter-2
VLEDYSVKLVLVLTIGFGLSSVLGYLTFKMGLSPILGYLFAGYIIGPFSPGIVVDIKVTEQLAEIGVILMMFGVGLYFKWQDLLSVRKIAIPGAILQMLIAIGATAVSISLLGWPFYTGLIIGMALGVSSTIVMLRVFVDNKMLETTQGHIAIGWTIVEDLLTVVVLILMSVLAEFIDRGVYSIPVIVETLIIVAFKMIILFALVFTLGQRIVSKLLAFISETQSQELFTIAILALTFMIATGSSFIFGTSFALGAFLAGMVIGRTKVRQEAAINSLPMRDAFVVLFFLSIGMLFNPVPIIEYWPQFLCVLAVILLVKPLATFTIVKLWKYPTEIALGAALALAQIGEFSFILAEEALNLRLLPDPAFDIIVAAAFVSIALNPPIFRLYSQANTN